MAMLFFQYLLPGQSLLPWMLWESYYGIDEHSIHLSARTP
jgi:hypothetical protein